MVAAVTLPPPPPETGVEYGDRGQAVLRAQQACLGRGDRSRRSGHSGWLASFEAVVLAAAHLGRGLVVAAQGLGLRASARGRRAYRTRPRPELAAVEAVSCASRSASMRGKAVVHADGLLIEGVGALDLVLGNGLGHGVLVLGLGLGTAGLRCPPRRAARSASSAGQLALLGYVRAPESRLTAARPVFRPEAVKLLVHALPAPRRRRRQRWFFASR